MKNEAKEEAVGTAYDNATAESLFASVKRARAPTSEGAGFRIAA